MRVPTRVLRGLLAVLAFGCAGACSQTISPALLQDAQTAVRVKTALVNDPVLGVRPIEVSVVNGVARLSGSVASDVERQHGVDLARSVDGVRDVRAEIVVRATTAADEPGAVGTEPDGTYRRARPGAAGRRKGRADREHRRRRGASRRHCLRSQ